MSTPPSPDPNSPPMFGASPQAQRAEFPWKPVLVAACVLLAIAAILIAWGMRQKPGPQFASSALAPPDAYAANLPISDIKMSEADSFAGNKATYIDGTIRNTGDKTVDAAQLQVVFNDDNNMMAQKEVLPLAIIRAHEPYVDTVPVEAAPLKPGATAEFRLIFEHVTAMWNQQYPQITVVQTHVR